MALPYAEIDPILLISSVELPDTSRLMSALLTCLTSRSRRWCSRSLGHTGDIQHIKESLADEWGPLLQLRDSSNTLNMAGFGNTAHHLDLQVIPLTMQEVQAKNILSDEISAKEKGFAYNVQPWGPNASGIEVMLS